MIKNILSYWMIVGLAITLVSCGGEEVKKKTSEEIQKEIKDVVGAKEVKAKIDVKKSMVHWKGTMMGMYSHLGLVDFSSGDIVINDGNLVSGSFEVDLSTMRATDDNFDPKAGSTVEKLIGHLKSPQFFDVAGHPNATFVITSVDGNVATGKLTVRGKTNEEKVTGISIKKDGDNFVMKGSLTFDRKKYGVSFDLPAKDKVLSNDITLTITLVAKV